MRTQLVDGLLADLVQAVRFLPVYTRASVALLSEQTPFISEVVSSILSLPNHVKRVCQRSAESRGVFSRHSVFLPQGKLTVWVRIKISRKVISYKSYCCTDK